MRYVETIIIGGGPAGSTCAWQLNRNTKEVLILDKAEFPRLKLCAGWITSQVMSDLQFARNEYPYGLLDLDVSIHLPLIPCGLQYFPTKWKNYSIRRTEFDDWLLKRSAAEVIQWRVKEIKQRKSKLHPQANYVIDEQFCCKHLVGAGGTNCPVTKAFFKHTRERKKQLVTLEKEFHYPQRSDKCHLFFAKHALPGYSWYVPKADGYLNIGVGGLGFYLKKGSKNIHDHWSLFIGDLEGMSLIDNNTGDSLRKTGHPYFLNSFHGKVKTDNCFIVGDAAGLASMDLGEGIGPAIESALMAADEIIGKGDYQKQGVNRYSLQGIIEKMFSALHQIGRYLQDKQQ